MSTLLESLEASFEGNESVCRGSEIKVAKGSLMVSVYRFGSFAIRKIPIAWLPSIARISARLVKKFSKQRQFLVSRHLTRVNEGAITEKELDEQIGRSFENYARYWVDSARIPQLSNFEIDAGFTVEGFEHIEDGWASGVGPILALPHLGGWEWAGRWLTCCPKYEVTVVVEPQNPPELFQFMVEYRQAFGMNVIPLGPNAGKQVIKALKANHVVCLLCDRDIEGQGIEVDFFGEKTTVPAGPATLALRTGAHLIPVAVYQRENSHHAVVCPPIATPRTGRLRDDVATITQNLMDVFEDLVKDQPEQWHLMQPNWPSDYTALEVLRSKSA
ncbi:MAG: phosphatidylinositol mannoside acyltransferase [Acidimicrobiales bacterium]|jgi:phosphatidylinositol dimannoside acyltransferase|nr:phosphatidylinositol mannoside acyltransferase [Acidimicrobiales bacterium]